MKCEMCGKREATMHYRRIINGHAAEAHLCGGCAGSAGLSLGGFFANNLGNPFGFLGNPMPGFSAGFDPFGFNPPNFKFFGSLLGGLMADGGAAMPEAAEAQSESARCPVCRKSFDDIASCGKLGCESCYRLFARQLHESIARLHGSAVHTGKRPGGAAAQAPPPPEPHPVRENAAAKIAGLKSRLNRAIVAQEYERCAELRDEIKRLEGEMQ